MVNSYVSEVAWHLPLQDLPPVCVKTLELRAAEFKAKLIIRADFSDKSTAGAIGSACGIVPPEACRFVGKGRDRRLIWLGPNELLFTCAAAQSDKYKSDLQTALAKKPHAVVEVSDYYVGLGLQGEGTCVLLNSECPLDLRLCNLPVGSAVGTVFAHANILLCRTAEQAFDIQVRASFGEYLWKHLSDGMRFCG